MSKDYSCYEVFLREFKDGDVCIQCDNCSERNYVVRWFIDNEGYFVDPGDTEYYKNIAAGTATNDDGLFVSTWREGQFDCDRNACTANTIHFSEFVSIIDSEVNCSWEPRPISELFGMLE